MGRSRRQPVRRVSIRGVLDPIALIIASHTHITRHRMPQGSALSGLGPKHHLAPSSQRRRGSRQQQAGGVITVGWAAAEPRGRSRQAGSRDHGEGMWGGYGLCGGRWVSRRWSRGASKWSEGAGGGVGVALRMK